MRSQNQLYIFFKNIVSTARNLVRKSSLLKNSLENSPSEALPLQQDFPGNQTDNRCVNGQEIYVVWDALGDGRVVGVFSDHELVKKILKVNPHYYRYYRCEFNRPLPLAVEWLDEDARKQLLFLCKNNSN